MNQTFYRWTPNTKLIILVYTKSKPGLPSVVRDAIKPNFMDLSDDNLLKKYLYGQTQKNNESSNRIIWKRCLNDVSVGRSTLEMGVASAIISFNDNKVAF